MASFLSFIRQRLSSFLPTESAGAEFALLLSPRQHSMLLNHRRAALIINRVRLFALLFVVLTPLWSLVDITVFSYPLWTKMVALRVLASIAFAAVLVFYRPTGQLLDAYRAMLVLFIIPTLFYIASHLLLAGHQLNGLSSAVATGYAFLPFVLMAGLAVFPLSLIENVFLAIILLAAQTLAAYLNWSVLSWPSFVGGFWLLALIAAVSSLASTSQLVFMMTLVCQVIRDPLTGAYSRGSGNEILNTQWAAAQRNQQPLALAFIDLDHFKEVNDIFGHVCGDTVLRHFARELSKKLRNSDSLLRWGGEEFVLIMPNTTLDKAQLAILRIIKDGFGNRPDGTPLTASIGLAEHSNDGLKDPQQLIALADKRMYQAKQAGRNRICSAC